MQLNLLPGDFGGLESLGGAEMLFSPDSDVLSGLDLPPPLFADAPGTSNTTGGLLDPLRPPSPMVVPGFNPRNSPTTSESGNRGQGGGGASGSGRSSDDDGQPGPQEDEAKRLVSYS